MSESKTPRVDAIVERLHGSDSQPFLDFARTLELELNEAKQTLPLNSKLRLIDLVRYARSLLHQEELITDDEYAELCSITESPKRLMEYDELRSQLTAAQQEIAIKDTLIEEVREFTTVCVCGCGEKMIDTDLALFLSRYDSAMKGSNSK